MFGTRSGQVVMWYGVPSAVFQSTAPVVASSPYTQLFSVVAIRVLPTTSGCPYTAVDGGGEDLAERSALDRGRGQGRLVRIPAGAQVVL